jgi:ComF family protein
MLKDIINLFYPNLCVSCKDLLLQNESIICVKCRHEIPFLEHQIPLSEKFYGRLDLEHISGILEFHKQGIVQKLIHDLKYRNREDIGVFIANLYEKKLLEIHSQSKFDYIIPVPLHPKKMKIRGYNQLTTFGNQISKIINVPLLDDVLVRNVHTETQTKKGLISRTDMKENIFGIHPKTFIEKMENKHFLIIDDVITTGSTLELSARALLKIHKTRLSILVMAASDF